MSTHHTVSALIIPKALNFNKPRPAQRRVHATRGRWIVSYWREGFSRSVRDWAYFKRRADANAFYAANVEGRA